MICATAVGASMVRTARARVGTGVACSSVTVVGEGGINVSTALDSCRLQPTSPKTISSTNHWYGAVLMFSMISMIL